MARKVKRKATRPAELTASQRKYLAEPISVLELPTRPTNALERAGVFYIRDLLSRTREEILQIHDVGEKTLDEVFEKLEKEGFYRAG